MTDVAFSRPFPGGVEEALDRLGPELKQRGFGTLATLRVHDILKEKIGAEVDPLVILDVCSPREAYRALTIDRGAALLLPCKVIVSREKGATQVTLLRPSVAVQRLLPTPELERLGEDVERSLRDAIEAATTPLPRPSPVGG